LKLEKPEEAEASCRRAVELMPGRAEAHNNLGNALKEQGKLEEAVVCFRAALELKPRFAQAHNNLGFVLREQGKLDEAISCFRHALDLEPALAEAHINLGDTFKDQGKPDDAASAFRRAIELEPGLAKARTAYGMFLLQLGRYEEGWREYEHRLADDKARRRFSKPRWNGERVEGGTLLLHNEQGFGDTLQFIRYAPLAREQTGARQIIIEAQPALARLLEQNHGADARIFPGVETEEASLPPFDCQIPLLSLPLALGLSEPLPMTGGYIRADETLRQTWRQRLGASSAIRVGLVWAGNPANKVDRRRSMSTSAPRAQRLDSAPKEQKPRSSTRTSPFSTVCQRLAKSLVSWVRRAPLATANSAPLLMQKMPTRFIKGKPHPGFWLLLWG